MWSDEFLLYLIHVALVCHPVAFGVDTVFFLGAVDTAPEVVFHATVSKSGYPDKSLS